MTPLHPDTPLAVAIAMATTLGLILATDGRQCALVESLPARWIRIHAGFRRRS